MTKVPEIFKEYIKVVYPPNNTKLFEEWFYENYKKEDNNSEYKYLPVFWTGYHVNNNYGNDINKRKELQNYIDSLDRCKKYFTVLQYDDGCLVDFKDLEIRVFGASGKDATDHIPLLELPQPFQYTESERNNFACFMGSNTHPIRAKMLSLVTNKEAYHINTGRLSIDEYCKILSNSVFSLCPRGYGINSFRIQESIQYGAIPVYISDEFSIPAWLDFESFGVVITEKELSNIDNVLQKITQSVIKKKQDLLPEAFEKYYTYSSNYKLILNKLYEG